MWQANVSTYRQINLCPSAARIREKAAMFGFSPRETEGNLMMITNTNVNRARISHEVPSMRHSVLGKLSDSANYRDGHLCSLPFTPKKFIMINYLQNTFKGTPYSVFTKAQKTLTLILGPTLMRNDSRRSMVSITAHSQCCTSHRLRKMWDRLNLLLQSCMPHPSLSLRTSSRQTLLWRLPGFLDGHIVGITYCAAL